MLKTREKCLEMLWLPLQFLPQNCPAKECILPELCGSCTRNVWSSRGHRAIAPSTWDWDFVDLSLVRLVRGFASQRSSPNLPWEHTKLHMDAASSHFLSGSGEKTGRVNFANVSFIRVFCQPGSCKSAWRCWVWPGGKQGEDIKKVQLKPNQQAFS